MLSADSMVDGPHRLAHRQFCGYEAAVWFRTLVAVDHDFLTSTI